MVGSQDWLADRPEVHDDVVAMINRDGSPSTITGAVVPPLWSDEMKAITEPLEDLNPRWPFELTVDPFPSLKPDSPGGSDHSSFAMLGIPLLRFRTETDYSYGRAWHTLYDTYSELVPYEDHQEHSALVTAVVAYGIANLDEPLPREGVYLPDGLFADLVTESGARVMVSLDYEHAPVQVSHFIRAVEGGRGQNPGAFRRPSAGPVGRIHSVDDRVVSGILEGGELEDVGTVPLGPNPVLSHEEPGIFGLSGPNDFYLTRVGIAEAQAPGTALGRIVAGHEALGEIASGEEIRRIRILRSGEVARAFAAGVAAPGSPNESR